MNGNRNPLLAAGILVGLAFLLAGGLRVAGAQVVGWFQAIEMILFVGLVMWAVGLHRGERR